MVGISKDESRELTIGLPTDFHNEVLKGKNIELAVTCTSVKQKRLPELDDDFAKKLLGEEATLETLRKEVEASVRQRREQGRESSLANQVLGFLHDKLDFELPAEVVEREQQKERDAALELEKLRENLAGLA